MTTRKAGSAILFWTVLLVTAGLWVSPQSAPGAAAAGNAADGVRRELLSRYRDLLIEKAVLDDAGREIDGRLAGLIADARGPSKAKSDQAVLAAVLEALNFSASNLAGFPAAAFDRPIGARLSRFGQTIAPSDINATAEGSACPLGGIGAGSFERLMNGNFHTWFLKSGWMVEDTVWADQFHVFMKSGPEAIAQTLSTGRPPAALGGLSTWAWNYPAGKGDYFALFPKSGFSYEKNSAWPVKLAVVQFSPVIPGNYRETSYPVAVYRWIAENPGDRPVELSVMLTWENMVGWEAVPARAGHQASAVWDRDSFGATSEFMEQGPAKAIVFKKASLDVKTGNAMTGTMAIAALETPGKTRVHYLADFDPKGEGAEVWSTFAADGTLRDSKASRLAAKGQGQAGALAVKVTLGPRERVEIPFVVAWDFPFYEFEPGAKVRKKYTQFFGEEATGTNAFAIAAEALGQFRRWEKDIDDWQATFLRDRRLPGWFVQALLNELYVLPETSIWDAETNLHTYLESADYLMYGTFDVDSYCWQVLRLWPELELGNVRFFAGTVGLEDPVYKVYQYAVVSPQEIPPGKAGYYWNVNKAAGMMPHDIGSPRKRPWVVLNAFDWQNGNVWKDLNPKFPLRALRDYLASGSKDLEFLKTVFAASVTAMDTLERKFGDPGSHVPLCEAIPDQTYDTWRMKGESAYVGLLWLAALDATAEMGDLLVRQGQGRVGDVDTAAAAARYRSWLEAGRSSIERLWDAKAGYFHIDASTDDIMADQLFGPWYISMLGLDARTPVITEEQMKRTLRTIYEKNVLGFGGGLMGAANGRTAAGKQLLSQQGDEVWIGTSYAYAANCILHGLREEGLHTAYGLYHVVWSPFGQGYFFKTPEAYLNPEEAVWNNPSAKYGDKLFRAMKYMRPGAVWAVYEALLKNPR